MDIATGATAYSAILEALISRPVFYDMVELAVEEEVAGRPMSGVWSGGRFFPIGPAA